MHFNIGQLFLPLQGLWEIILYQKHEKFSVILHQHLRFWKFHGKRPSMLQQQKPFVDFADDKVQIDTQQSQQKDADELNGKHSLEE